MAKFDKVKMAYSYSLACKAGVEKLVRVKRTSLVCHITIVSRCPKYQVSSRGRTCQHEGALPQVVAYPLHWDGERVSKHPDGVSHDEQYLRKPRLPPFKCW